MGKIRNVEPKAKVLVALMPFGSFTVGNGIVISDKLVEEEGFVSVQAKEFRVEVQDTRLGLEILTRDIPLLSEEALKNLDERGIIRPGVKVKRNDVLVGKIAPKGNSDMSPEYKLLYSVFGEKTREEEDTSRYYPFRDEGIVVVAKHLKESGGLRYPVEELVKVYVVIFQNLKVGDILEDEQGHRGVITKILPNREMPYRRGEKIEMVVNPFSDFGQVELDSNELSIGKTKPITLLDGRTRGTVEWQPYPNRPEVVKKVEKKFEGKYKIGYLEVKKMPRLSEERFEVRSVGQYSLTESRPLDGQLIAEQELRVLEGVQAFHLLQEMVTLKSDNLKGRIEVYEAIVEEKEFPSPGRSETISIFTKFLQGLDLKTLIGEEKIEITLASPEDIKSWSQGEVKNPETINYATFRPEKQGLFCEKIFGPTRDWECFCGKYKSIRYRGRICDCCGVEVTESKVRRERFGHIELVSPVIHIWYLPDLVKALEISQMDLEKVVYCESYLILDPKESGLKKYQIIATEEFQEYRGKAEVATGAEAIKKALQEKENYLQNMILQIIPIIPPDLRPMIETEKGIFATSDLNDLYRRVINRNNRLKRLIEMKAPEVIAQNEQRMLQEAVDALLDNGRKGKPIRDLERRPLISLSDMVKRNAGKFWKRRQDFSAKGIVVVAPELEENQCFLPKEMALELFKPFVMGRLVSKGIVFNLKSARRLVENENTEAYEVLEEVIKGRMILLKSSQKLQAFGINLWEEEAIGLSSKACEMHGIKLNGDSVAVFLPLSKEAQAEAKDLLSKPIELQEGEISSFVLDLFPQKDSVESLIEGIIKGKGKITLPLSQIDKLALGRV